MKYCNIAQKYGSKVVVGGSLLVASAQSNAAIVAADLTGIVTEVTTDASLVFTTFLPVIGTVIAMIVGVKLIKRFSSKV